MYSQKVKRYNEVLAEEDVHTKEKQASVRLTSDKTRERGQRSPAGWEDRRKKSTDDLATMFVQ